MTKMLFRVLLVWVALWGVECAGAEARVHIVLRNKTPFPVTFVFTTQQELVAGGYYTFDDTNETVAAGTTKDVTFDALPADATFGHYIRVTYAQYSDGYTQVGNSFIRDGGADAILLTGGDSGYTNTFVLLDASAIQAPQVTPVDLKSIWEAPVTGDDTDLKANVYREGVDKIVAAVTAQATNAVSGDTGGGTGGDPGADSMREAVATSIQAAVDATPAHGFTADDGAAGTGSMKAQGSAAASAAVSSLQSGTGGAAPTGLGYSMGSGSSAVSSLSVAMPAAFGGQTFNMNPFASDRFQDVCDWFRTAVAWTALILLGVWAWPQFGDCLRGMMQARQARGNAVVGGTGGQATALLAAGIITVAALTAIVGLAGWAFDSVSFPAIRAAMLENPVTGIPTKVFWMVNQLFPVSVLVTCFVAKIAWNMWSTTIFLTFASVVRFVVP